MNTDFDSYIQHYAGQISKIQHLDEPLAANEWNQGLGRDEVEQTFKTFIEAQLTKETPTPRELRIKILGEMTPEEIKMVIIVADYVKQVHGLKTSLDTKAIPIKESTQRRQCPKEEHEQYDVVSQLEEMSQERTDDEIILCFTNKDLYPASHPDIDFIYGVGYESIGCGLFSSYRMGEHKTPEQFESCLKRLMRLAIHELAHMRGLDHCTTASCNIAGVETPEDIDAAPHHFCAKDAAKLSALNNEKIKTLYERQAQFFRDFQEKYELEIDFKTEIFELEKRISILDK